MSSTVESSPYSLYGHLSIFVTTKRGAGKVKIILRVVLGNWFLIMKAIVYHLSLTRQNTHFNLKEEKNLRKRIKTTIVYYAIVLRRYNFAVISKYFK